MTKKTASPAAGEEVSAAREITAEEAICEASRRRREREEAYEKMRRSLREELIDEPARKATLSTVSQLYERWCALGEAYDRQCTAVGDDQASDAYDAYCSIEEELIAAPSITIRDLAMKIVVVEDAGGEIAGGGLAGEALVAEARRLVAILQGLPD